MTPEGLKALRQRRGWSQRDLSRLINEGMGRKTNHSTIGQWENGRRNITAPVSAFLDRLAQEDEPETFAETTDEFRPGDTSPPPPAPDGPGVEQTAATVAAIVGGGSYARVCEELWELVATGVGMVGAVTGSEKLQDDGKIILQDKAALGKAYGKLAEQNATFRNMLVGMSGGGAWLEVALVSGITAGKLMRNHQSKPVVVEPVAEQMNDQEPGGRMYGDGAVIDLPV